MNHRVTDRPIMPESRVNTHRNPFVRFTNEDISQYATTLAHPYTINNSNTFNSGEYFFRNGDVEISISEIVELKQQVEELRAEVLKLKTGQIKLHTEEVEL